jgi:UDP-N-acetyl-D-mannosaminuronic acid dehydrogenase
MSQTAALIQQIESKSAKIAVIGVGYVGLPVACMIAKSGFRVTGVDVNAPRIAVINSGQSPIGGDEPGIAELIAEVTAAGGLQATTDYTHLADVNIAILCIDTPIEAETHYPLYRGLRSALQSLGSVLATGTLVIVESTIAPGTMHNVVIPALEQASGKKSGVDFFVGHCPERVTPGLLLHNLTKLSRSVGGQTPEIAQVMVALYKHYVQGDLDPTDMLTAEVVKTAENALRDVQIAFAIELAMVCETLGADVYKVRELLNKVPGRNMLYPGAGVGGHCIPKDPWLLIANVGDQYQARLIPAARAVNASMPHHIVDLVEHALDQYGLKLKNARIAVLGYAFKEDTDDDRDSPSIYLVEELKQRGAVPVIHDPYIETYRVPLDQIVQGANALVIMDAHREYKQLDLKAMRRLITTPIIIDGRNTVNAQAALQHGFTYMGVGYRPSTNGKNS